jgi:DNA processing protein
VFSQEILNTAILTRLSYYHLNTMVELYRQLGSATAIVEQRKELQRLFPGLPRKISEALADIDAVRKRAEEELEYAERTHYGAHPPHDGYRAVK